MNQEFIRQALHHGKEKWLKKIPDLIKKYEKEWTLKVLPPFNLSYNYVATAIRKDGTRVVLKIGFPKDKEFQTEIDALTVFNGEGSAKIFESDKNSAVILIERVTPGIPLSSIDDDEKATKILASVMKKLWKPLPPNNKFITISEWMTAIPKYLEKYKGKSSPLPKDLIEKANNLFTELTSTSTKPVLVHGDLHHGNVLSSNRDTWLAIDPKGIAAEREYETAAMIRNPYEKMKDEPDLKNILRKRILILAEELEFDPKRIHKWCLAQTVLSAVWNYGEIKGAQHAVKIAKVLDRITI